jgi:hypothetical protein
MACHSPSRHLCGSVQRSCSPRAAPATTTLDGRDRGGSPASSPSWPARLNNRHLVRRLGARCRSFTHVMENGASALGRGGEVSIVHVDRRIGELAAEQDSLFTWAQLRAIGLGRGAIEHRVRRGVLHRVHVGSTRGVRLRTHRGCAAGRLSSRAVRPRSPVIVGPWGCAGWERTPTVRWMSPLRADVSGERASASIARTLCTATMSARCGESGLHRVAGDVARAHARVARARRENRRSAGAQPPRVDQGGRRRAAAIIGVMQTSFHRGVG